VAQYVWSIDDLMWWATYRWMFLWRIYGCGADGLSEYLG
jgi:hypothetical protein